MVKLCSTTIKQRYQDQNNMKMAYEWMSNLNLKLWAYNL